MPQQNGKQKPQISEQERNRLIDESMQRAYQKVSGEMPDVKPVSVTPRQSSFLTNLFMPRGAYAVTNPFTGNITYNPDMMVGQSPVDMEQTLAHELTHTRQTQNQPWYKTIAEMFMPDEKVPAGIPASSSLNNPYYWRPREMEAFQAENDRTRKLGLPIYSDPVLGTRDIMLPPEKKKSGIDTGPNMGSPMFQRR